MANDLPVEFGWRGNMSSYEWRPAPQCQISSIHREYLLTELVKGRVVAHWWYVWPVTILRDVDPPSDFQIRSRKSTSSHFHVDSIHTFPPLPTTLAMRATSIVHGLKIYI